MVKTKYISFVFFLLIAATVIKLFQKPPKQSRLPSGLSLSKNVSGAVNVCSLYGYACPNKDVNCNCENLVACNTSEELVPFRVLEGENVYVMEKRLLPGTYCLPKGVGVCDAKTSIEFFTLAGWSCIPKNVSWLSKRIPCAHSEAKDNSLNVLWDMAKNSPANETTIEDYYETIINSKGETIQRYVCKCNSLDFRNRPMVSILPLTCSVDECVIDINNPLPFMGWNGKQCECGPYKHKDVKDLTSRCLTKKTERGTDDVLDARVECTSKNSLIKSGIYCPEGKYFLSFQTTIMEGSDPLKFVDNIVNTTGVIM